MFTAALQVNPPLRQDSGPASRVSDQFAAIAGLIASEFYYKKDEEIFGEGEPSEYVYQVVSGAVRTYKLLSDGRRQIGSFPVAGDVFGLESGSTHRLTTEAIRRYYRALCEALGPRESRDNERAGRAQALEHDGRRTQPRRRSHAAARSQDRRRKVAAFLLEMDRRLAGAGMLALPMCRRDIGDNLGLTLETISRALSQVHTEGILGFSGARQIVLRDRQRLRDMDV